MKKHIVRINIANRNGEKRTVLTGKKISIPRRILNFMFGDFCEVFVLTPGKSVAGIEINETHKDCECDE